MYGVVWQHNTPESGDRRLLPSPESLEDLSTAEEAKKEGIQIHRELAHEHRSVMKPLAIVEISEEMLFSLQGCERIFLPNEDDDGELEFVNISDTQLWTSQPWWRK